MFLFCLAVFLRILILNHFLTGENQRENQRAHLQEMFPVPNLDPHGSSVGTSNAPQSKDDCEDSMLHINKKIKVGGHT